MILAPVFLRQLAENNPPIAPVYLIYGEEPLYVRRATDALRAYLQAAGFAERETFDADARFDWDGLRMETQSGSLFAEQRIIELQMPTGNPGKAGTEFIQEFCNQNQQDMVLIVYCEKLDSRQTKAKWVQAIEAAGMVVQAKPLEAHELPNWCIQQARRFGLTLEHEAASFLADQIEGNLLAADQELEKLSLIKPAGATISLQDVEQIVMDQSHFQLFALSKFLLLGQAKQALHILNRLKQEGDTEAPVVLWLLARELRTLLELVQKQQQMPLPQVMKAMRIWSSKQGEYRQALNRHNLAKIQNLLQQAYQIDRQIKGMETGDAWLGLSDLTMKMAS